MSDRNLVIKHIELSDANRFVEERHRHHGKVQGHKFSIGVYKDDELVGVAIVGRPQGRRLDDGQTLEVLRLCTDGTYNACSILYGRCARIAKEMGYAKIITFILQSESGNSLKASGWKLESEKCGGMDWTQNQRYSDRQNGKQLSFIPQKQPPREFKKRYSKSFNEKET